MEAKMVNPMDRMFAFLKFLDYGRVGTGLASNFNVRGSLVTIYMQVDELIHYVNICRDYEHKDTEWWTERGYPKQGYYYRIGPYHIRFAYYREKMQKDLDSKIMHEKYIDEISELKRKLYVANSKLNQITETIKK